jgi:hypothetical protein
MGTFILSLAMTVAFFVGGILYFDGDFGLFFVPAPLLILVLFPLIFHCILCGNIFKKTFVIAFEKKSSKASLQKAYNFFKNYGETVWVTAITLIATYTVICMKYLEDKSGLGPMLQSIIDTIIYAGLLHLLIVLPYKTVIKNKIISSE